jgi:ribonuclease HII
MSRDPADLSVAEIRRRWVETDETPSPQLLSKLRRDPRSGVRRICRLLEKRRDAEKEERQRLAAMLHFEKVLWASGLERVAGVDEAGVGPLAGPVVAAAVVFPPETEIAGIDDSKRLDARKREKLETVIRDRAAGVGIGVAEVDDIDRLNVYRASLLAMRRAVEALPESPQHVLVDAREIPDLDIPQNPFDKGDGLNFSIAAASILAKTHRDRHMEELDRRWPEYGFARHKGYATEEHREAVRRHGPCPVHRRSYGVFGELAGDWSDAFYRLREALDGDLSRDELGRVETRLDAASGKLTRVERQKLRTLLNRRWKTT